MEILAAAAFVVRSTYHTAKGKSPGQLFFGRDMILPINHVVDWRYIRQRKQMQIDNDIIQENNNRIDQDYRVGDKVITLTNSAYKYKTPYRGPYKIFQACTNGTVTLRMGAVAMRLNIRNIKPCNTPIL